MSKNKRKFCCIRTKCCKFAVICATIATFGDAIQTIAAALAIQQKEIDLAENAQSNQNFERQLRRMQKQLDYLTSQFPKQ